MTLDVDRVTLNGGGLGNKEIGQGEHRATPTRPHGAAINNRRQRVQ